LPDLTKLLELTGPKALGLFLACLALRLANAYGYVALADIHASAAAVNDVVMFVSGALAAMWLVEAPINWIRGKVWQRSQRHLIRRLLSTLSAEEETALRGLLQVKQQSLSAPMTDPLACRLVHKGLLDQATGVGNRLAWSFMIPPMVWQEMRRRWPED
jgi:hypothetical protein